LCRVNVVLILDAEDIQVFGGSYCILFSG
jgi:hypothetical protein